MIKKPWGGRFHKNINKLAETFSTSIHIDHRLFKQEIEVNIAYAKALKKAKILNTQECNSLIKELNTIAKKLDQGKIKLSEQLEDVHMNIEHLLVEKLGDLGKKLHTGRSRNDLIVTDLRIYLKEKTKSILHLLTELQKTLINVAEKHIDLIMPGYTHLQQAQPILVAHHFMAYFEMFNRDKQRLQESLKRIDIMPLGSAALSGTGFPIDRNTLAQELGFSDISANSIDAVSDRDFIAETIFAISLIMMHLSRLCEELIIWSSQEFNFITIGDEYTTGSSIMPQKKNPDMAELIRGKTGSTFGNLLSILILLKGLPLAYNRDLQEDKKPLFDSIDTVEKSLAVFSGMLLTIKFNTKAINLALQKGSICATELANYLVEKGESFRNAHNIVGNIIKYCETNNKTMESLSLSTFNKFSRKIADDVYMKISLKQSVTSKNRFGGTAPRLVKQAIKKAKQKILNNLV